MKRIDTRGYVGYRALFELQTQLVQDTMETMQIELGQVKIEMLVELGQVKIEMQIEQGLVKIMGYRVHPFEESMGYRFYPLSKPIMVSLLLQSQFHRKNGR